MFLWPVKLHYSTLCTCAEQLCVSNNETEIDKKTINSSLQETCMFSGLIYPIRLPTLNMGNNTKVQTFATKECTNNRLWSQKKQYYEVYLEIISFHDLTIYKGVKMHKTIRKGSIFYWYIKLFYCSCITRMVLFSWTMCLLTFYFLKIISMKCVRPQVATWQCRNAIHFCMSFPTSHSYTT